MVEKHCRSVVKAISYRTTGTLTTTAISLIVTGSLGWAVSIGVVELFTKVFIYYLHERIWNRISFGRIPPPSEDYQI